MHPLPLYFIDRMTQNLLCGVNNFLIIGGLSTVTVEEMVVPADTIFLCRNISVGVKSLPEI